MVHVWRLDGGGAVVHVHTAPETVAARVTRTLGEGAVVPPAAAALGDVGRDRDVGQAGRDSRAHIEPAP